MLKTMCDSVWSQDLKVITSYDSLISRLNSAHNCCTLVIITINVQSAPLLTQVSDTVSRRNNACELLFMPSCIQEPDVTS